MDRINFFNPFIHKTVEHEDSLTRAFLVLLRYEPLAQSLFLDLVRERLAATTVIVPSLTQMKEPISVQTQVTRLDSAAGKLVSVLVTDRLKDDLPQVQWSDRTPRYDGVISYGDWTFVLEVKPSASNVWHEQLNPSRMSVAQDSELELVEQPVCLVWHEFFEGLLDLSNRKLLEGKAELLVNDFLSMIEERHPELAPYKRFALCGDDFGRLWRRNRMVLESIASRCGAEVGERRDRAPHLLFTSGIAKEAHLAIDQDSEHGEWSVWLGLWPADTVSQARAFYSQANRGKFFSLRHRGWEIYPNLHFSYISTHLVWSQTSMKAEPYYDLWANGVLNYGQVPAEGDSYHHEIEKLERHDLLTASAREQLDNAFLNTRRSTMNVVPGMSVQFHWSREKAIELDDQGKFEEAVLEKIIEALTAWDQQIQHESALLTH